MASSLSKQLAKVAATSTNQLDLRAQRHAHSQSLLFDPKVAATQDFETIYDHCVVGFQDLCRIDPRFLQLSSSVFSESSKSRERGQLTAAENAELDVVLERFLILSCKHLLLQPTQKALEWLVRRFRIHEHNTETLVLSFLIYHPLPIFSTLLSILPKKLPRSLKFLHPYRERLQTPAGDVIQHAANTNTAFWEAWTMFVLKSCKWGYHHEPVLSYWAVRTASAIESQLAPVHVGNAQAQRQREDDVIRKITGVLDKALVFRRIPSILVGCFIIIERLVLAANLSTSTVCAYMDAISAAAVPDVHGESIIALVQLVQKLKSGRLPQLTFKFVMSIDDIVERLLSLAKDLQVGTFVTSLTIGIVNGLSSENLPRGIPILARLLTNELLSQAQLETVLREMVRLVLEDPATSTGQSSSLDGLRSVLIQLLNSPEQSNASITVKRLAKDSRLYAVLGLVPKAALPEPSTTLEDMVMAESQADQSDLTLDMPMDFVVPASYLLDDVESAFNQSAAVFTSLPRSPNALEQFLVSGYIGSGFQRFSLNTVTFFLRYAFSSFPHINRAFAILCIAKLLQGMPEPVNTQYLLPYTLVGLADSSNVVRSATASLLMAMQSNSQGADAIANPTSSNQEMYGQSLQPGQVTILQLRNIVQAVIIPGLDECKMDSVAVKSLVHDSLTGNTTVGLQIGTEKLKKSSRTALLALIADHSRCTPILRVASTLITLVSGISKVGLLSTSEAFEPSLRNWSRMDENALLTACTKENLAIKAFCADIVGFVTPNSTAGNLTLQQLIISPPSVPFINAILYHVSETWSSMPIVIRRGWSSLMFEQGILKSDHTPLSVAILEILRSVSLDTETLQDFIERLIGSSAASDDSSPASKRRKGHRGAIELSASATAENAKVFLKRSEVVLDLIRNSGAAMTYILLPGLFRALQILHKSRTSLQNDLNHAHWLFLTCLREVVDHSRKLELEKLDHSDMRVDLVVDALTHTSDLQTQFAALMLLSALARLDPELVIHSMMPVFTFMGSSVLKQDSDHATHVIDQTINSVVPPLIDSFRQQRGGALSGASGLILSFVAAFEHILPNRRIDLFSALVDKLGADEYLSVLFVVLQDRYGNQDIVQDFISSMMLNHYPVTGLKTVQKCIEILGDSFKARPQLLKQIFVSDKGNLQEEQSNRLAELPTRLLRIPQMPNRILRALRNKPSEAEIIRTIYADMVHDTLNLTLPSYNDARLSESVAAILGTLVTFFPVSESMRALEIVLQQDDEALRQEVLYSFATAIDRAQTGDNDSRQVSLNLLPSLKSAAETSANSEIVGTVIRCMSGIIKKYGKTNTTKVLELTYFLVGPKSLRSSDSSVQIVALGALAAAVNALEEEIIPVCPVMISTALELLSMAISRDSWNTEMHNATYKLFDTILSTIPWIITGAQLDRFLELSYNSASISTDESCNESRTMTLLMFAKAASPQTCFQALLRNWGKCVENGIQASLEHMQILDSATDKHSKASIVSNATLLTDHFIQTMNLRASSMNDESKSWGESQVHEVEDMAYSIFIKMIYKLNDTHFRPQFIRISEWATSSNVTEETTTIRKLTSWFAFLQRFFETLQSIVINYTTHIVDPIVEILTNLPPKTTEARLLWAKTIGTLHATFEHDRDDFWKSPARFSDICEPLITQLGHSSLVDDETLLVSCITAFAVAVESSEQRAEIHAKILQHFRSEDANVRRVMFTCEIGLTEALGDEWISLFDSSSTYPIMSEALEDDDEDVENEVRKWKLQIEEMTGESLDTRLQ